MKNMFLAFATIALISFAPRPQTTLNNIPVDSQLAYNVDFGGNKYQFIVELKQKDPNLVFDYNLSMGSGKQGKVTIVKEALQTARGQQNYFAGGEQTLSTQTTVWLSQVVYKEAKEKGKTTMATGESGDMRFVDFTVVGTEKMELQLNGENISLPCLHLRSTDGRDFEYWVWDNPKDPLILKMSIGWGLAIKEINVN
jgi:hypothetical protein